MSFRCVATPFEERIYNDDNNPTFTSDEQRRTEESVTDCYITFKQLLREGVEVPELHRYALSQYLLRGLLDLGQSYQCLDASRPWLCYWILHGLELLDVPVHNTIKSGVVDLLSQCQNESGGFGGGPGQDSHLAPTYAAVNALCILNSKEAYDVINRKALHTFIKSRKGDDGSFTMHEGGEVDIRGAYCAVNAAKITNILTPELFEGTGEWIARCQTYEGGFAGEPGVEAHGGYSFCGLAALMLLEKEQLCDIESLLRWTAFRQMSVEGGFQGRTNKLVDGCYSFWQGGAFPLIHMILAKKGDESLSGTNWMFDQKALQEYLLICCQHRSGGLIDKPGKPRDYYHTCYCLSGLSVAQHFNCKKLSGQCVVGKPTNLLKTIHPIFNIGSAAALEALQYFSQLDAIE